MARPRSLMVPAVLLASGVPLAIIGWMAWEVRSTWHRLDDAADEFQVPAGFEKVDTVRQGTAACFVTCTNGGEAIVTIVLSSEIEDPGDACDSLHGAVVELTGAATPGAFGASCGSNGELGDGASVWAGAWPTSSLSEPGSGGRWHEEVAPPDSAVVAVVEFRSGIE